MPSPGPALVPPLLGVRDALTELRFELRTASSARAAVIRDAAVDQIGDYLVPRLQSLDAPLLAVVGGSTGAGKSTLVNSLVGEDVTVAGVLRPTTRAPVLICHPDDRRWFDDDRVLPGLARTTGERAADGGAAGTIHLVESVHLPPGLALLDAPDIDSVVAANRALAGQLLAAADLWLFVTTAARYADAVPWDLLDEASRRRAAVAVILDRVPPEAVDEVSDDLLRLLEEHGLPNALLRTIAEGLAPDGRLPDEQVRPVREWLLGLAADAEARAEVIRWTLAGALDDLDARVVTLQRAAADEAGVATELGRAVDAAYDDAAAEVDEQVRTGTLLRGEVLARWQEFVGTGELMRTVQARVSSLRDKVWSAVTGRPSTVAGVQEAVEHGVEAVVHAAADRAAATAVASWRRTDAGAGLVAGHERELGRASRELLGRLPDEVREWQGAVLDLVRHQGADKRTSARIASYTLNGAGLAVMLAVFAHTGGLTGAEVAVAGGTSAASQKVLEAMFGDQAVRTLARDARDDLLARTGALLDGDARRFRALLAAAAPAAPRQRLDEAARAWTSARAS